MGFKQQSFSKDYGIKRGDLWLMPPSKPTKTTGGLVVIGLDTNHTRGQHRLWRADVLNPAKEDLIASIRKHGVITPIRARKLSRENDREAEVVVGRDRVKAARVVAAERGGAFLVPVMLWPMDTPDEEIMGAMNAENTQRKTETVLQTAEHLYMQAVSAGYPSNTRALNEVQASTGVSPTRQRHLFALRADAALSEAVTSGRLKGSAALALAAIEDEDLRARELTRALADPKNARVADLRERVSHLTARGTENDTDDADDAEGGESGEEHYPTEMVTEITHVVAPRKKKTKGANDTELPGVSKSLVKKLLEAQEAMVEPDLDNTALKVLRVIAGTAKPDTVKGFKAALQRQGL